MFNIIGFDINRDFSKYDGVFHSYNKRDIKAGRKMGHITFVDSEDMALDLKIKNYLEEL